MDGWLIAVLDTHRSYFDHILPLQGSVTSLGTPLEVGVCVALFIFVPIFFVTGVRLKKKNPVGGMFS